MSKRDSSIQWNSNQWESNRRHDDENDDVVFLVILILLFLCIARQKNEYNK